MAATSQMVRDVSVQTTNTWCSMFPEEQKTGKQSVLFVKKLVAIGISSITYLRTLFPEDAYLDQNLNGLKLKLLLDKTSCQSSNKLVDWMKGCFEAIEKQYLRQMTFAIYDDPKKPEKALETYTFKFSYDGEDGASIRELETHFSSTKQKRKFEVRRSTEKMLRTILLLTQTLKPLPTKIHLSMKLGYYDSVTPADYEPPGFKECEFGNFSFKSDPINIKIGDVSTRFHTVKVRVSVDKKAYNIDDNSANTQDEKEDNTDMNKASMGEPLPSSEPIDVIRSYASNSIGCTAMESLSPGGYSSLPNPDEASCEIGDDNGNEPSQIKDRAEQCLTIESEKQVPSCSTSEIDRLVSSQDETQLLPQTLTPNDPNVQSTGQTVGPKFAKKNDFVVRCPCGFNQDEGLMIMCDLCSDWQHAICFGILHESEAPSQHVCEVCSSPSMPSTDPSLNNRPQIKMYCLYRRALFFLYERRARISASLLAQHLSVDISIGKGLVSQLQKEKLIKNKKKQFFYANHANLVKFAFPKYLNRDPNENNANDCNVMSDITQTPHSMQSDADVTPDLPISSLRESINASKAEECQGRQHTMNSGLEVCDSDTIVITQDVADEVTATLSSLHANEEEAVTHIPAATQDLVQDCEMDEGDGEVLPLDSMTEQDDGKVKRLKRRLFGGVKLSRGKKTLPPVTLNLNDIEILDSQSSEALPAKRSKTSNDIAA